ncbi:glycosyltransferase family 4 protein [Enterococcus faecium]|uniref:glycosyltransferase family 4 protein n=3 Tax=Enterococcus faecium TaxID=1352 RepID=UPI001FFDB516
MARKKLKICMLGHKRIPSREGGIEIVVEELATRMVALGHEVTCYNRSGHHVSGKEFDQHKNKEYKGVKLKTIFTLNIKGIAAMSSSVFGGIRAAFGKYDVVHFHAEGPCAMLWLPKLFGKRCVATIHGLDHQREKWNKLASTYIMLGEKCAVKFADEIIVLSESVQNYFEDIYGRKTRFIPNGVKKIEIKSAGLITEKYGLTKDSYILFLGRLVPEKGIRYLIEAFKDVQTDKKLIIAGGSSDTDEFANELKELAKGDERIIFTGFVQGQELEELYSNAYIYTLPSDLEGMPLSLLEAMSYGNCCIVSNISECTEVVEDKAMIFKKSDVSDLKIRLEEACNQSEMVKVLKNQATEFICSKYNGSIISRTDRKSFYRSLLSMKKQNIQKLR